jgi:hypothetical protein
MCLLVQVCGAESAGAHRELFSTLIRSCSGQREKDKNIKVTIKNSRIENFQKSRSAEKEIV